MNDPNLDALAGEYVLGTLAGAEREAFARRLAADPEAQRLVDRWTARVGAMLSAPTVEPSAALWDRIDAAIGKRQAVDFGGVNVRAADGEWTEIAPGATARPSMSTKRRVPGVSFSASSPAPRCRATAIAG